MVVLTGKFNYSGKCVVPLVTQKDNGKNTKKRGLENNRQLKFVWPEGTGCRIPTGDRTEDGSD